VQNLAPVLREAIILRHWGGHTYDEIAEITGCPAKTAQSRVRLAHQKLAQVLGDADLQQPAEETR
jgi:DNA-directed RNA polymerase specialized sigma24 family protein